MRHTSLSRPPCLLPAQPVDQLHTYPFALGLTGELLPELEHGLALLLGSAAWEQRLGGLMGSKALAQHKDTAAFDRLLTSKCLDLLEDEEPRVRSAVGELLGLLAARRGLAVWEAAKGPLLTSIYTNYVSAAQRVIALGLGEPGGCAHASLLRCIVVLLTLHAMQDREGEGEKAGLGPGSTLASGAASPRPGTGAQPRGISPARRAGSPAPGGAQAQVQDAPDSSAGAAAGEAGAHAQPQAALPPLDLIAALLGSAYKPLVRPPGVG